MSTPTNRLRVSTDMSSDPMLYHNSNVPGDYYLSNWTTFRYYHSMNDIVGTQRSVRVKPAMSRKIVYSGGPWEAWFGDNGHTVSNPGAGTPYMDVNWFGVDLPEPDASALNTVCMAAFSDFSARFPEKVSATEFTQGLLELKGLIPKLQSSVMASLSSLHLQKTFGWDNLLADLNVLSSAFKSIESRMDFLLKTKGKPTKLHFAKKGFYQPVIAPREHEIIRGWVMRIEPISFRYDFHASCTLVQDLQHIKDEIGWFRAIVISLGLNNPLKRIWEVLPFSFVIDWFLNVSGHLDRVAAIHPAEQWDMFHMLHTWKFMGGFHIKSLHHNLNGMTNHDRYEGRVNVTTYKRALGLPLRLDGLLSTDLSPNQLLLMLAMGYA